MIINCKRCKGTGLIQYTIKEWDSFATNPLIVICTFGFSLVDGKNNVKYKKTCDACNGSGMLKIKEINN